MKTIFLKFKLQIRGLICDILVAHDGRNVDSLSMKYFYHYFADISSITFSMSYACLSAPVVRIESMPITYFVM